VHKTIYINLCPRSELEKLEDCKCRAIFNFNIPASQKHEETGVKLELREGIGAVDGCTTISDTISFHSLRINGLLSAPIEQTTFCMRNSIFLSREELRKSKRNT
jgi:hypothetical protein